MIQQQERADKFFRAIRRDAEQRRKEIVQQIDSYITAEAEKAEAEELRSAQDRVRYENERTQAQTNSRLAKATTDISAELAAKRTAITNEVFELAANRLKEFTKTEEYVVWLEKGLKEMADLLGSDMTVFTRKEDVETVKKAAVQVNTKCTVEVDEAILVGGVRAEKGSKKVDDTLDSRLKSQEDWFYQNSGLSIAIQ